MMINQRAFALWQVVIIGGFLFYAGIAFGVWMERQGRDGDHNDRGKDDSWDVCNLWGRN